MSTPAPAQGFPPICGDTPRILILGSMPSVRSLQAQQYYGHPRNRFWPLMSRLLEIPAGLDYPERCETLRDCGVAVWDVLASCQRPGSLDANILRGSEQANPIASWLAVRPSIQRLAFNGRAAEALFQRHISPDLKQGPLEQLALPSTSPANAAWSLERLAEAWGPAVQP